MREKEKIPDAFDNSETGSVSFLVSHSSQHIQAIRILTSNRGQLIQRPPTNNSNNKRTIINKPNRTITSKQDMVSNLATDNILEDIKLEYRCSINLEAILLHRRC